MINQLSEKAVLEYQAIYKKEFGKKLSKEEAREQAVSFLNKFRLVYKPIKKEWIETNNLKKRKV